MKITKDEICAFLAKHFSQKLEGEVSAFWDKETKTFCIQGSGLPAHTDLKHLYPSGWSMTSAISKERARKLLLGIG